MKAQTFITKAKREGNQARALNAQRHISQSTLDATVLVEGIDAQVIKCKARETFTKGRVTVEAGREFFLVRSSKFANRYYVVVWSHERSSWQCSCYCYKSANEHTQIVNEWIVDHVVTPKREQEVDPMKAKIAQAIDALRKQAIAANDQPAPQTKEEWKVALAKQKEADRQYKQAYIEAARSLRNSA